MNPDILHLRGQHRLFQGGPPCGGLSEGGFPGPPPFHTHCTFRDDEMRVTAHVNLARESWMFPPFERDRF